MVTASVIAHARHQTARSGRSIDRMVAHLRARGVAVDITFTQSAEEGTLAACRAADQAAVVIAVGGDGTVHSVIQGLVGTSTVLAIASAGSGNDGAGFIGHPGLHDPRLTEWLDATIDLLLTDDIDGPDLRIDLAHARCADGAHAYVLSVLSSGFDALVNARAHRLLLLPARVRYIVATVLELPRCVGRAYEITLPDGTVRADAVLIAVGNGAVYGRGMRICPSASVRDGLLNLTIIAEISRRTLLRLFPLVFSGRHVTDPRVTTAVTEQVTIAGPVLDCYADGERLGPLPVQIEVRPRSLRVAPALAAHADAIV